jgi:uncharacterized membrane protein required for colicin V production
MINYGHKASNVGRYPLKSALRGETVNWFDFVLLTILIVGLLYGMQTGLIKAAFVAVGGYAGWLLAGQFGGRLGSLFDSSLGNETLVSVISYAIIIVGALIVASIAAKIVKPLLTVFTLGLSGMVDKLGGLVLGLLIGVSIAGALVIGAARLTYDFDTSILTDQVPDQAASAAGKIEEQLAEAESVRESLETALSESQLVPTFISVVGSLPGDALGFIPADFMEALNILKAEIDKTDTD